MTAGFENRIKELEKRSFLDNDFPLYRIEFEGELYKELESYDIYIPWMMHWHLVAFQQLGIITRLDFMEASEDMEKLCHYLNCFGPESSVRGFITEREINEYKYFLLRFGVKDINMEEIFAHHQFDENTVDKIRSSGIKTVREFQNLVKKSGNINELQRAFKMPEYGKDDLDDIIGYCNYFVFPGTTFKEAEEKFSAFKELSINFVYKNRELRSGYLKQNNYEFSERQLWELLCSNLLDFAHIGHYIE